MGHRLRGHEKRLSGAGACTIPSAESLIGRLDQIDLRLRQLEEKQTLPVSYFTTDLRWAATRTGQHQCKPLSSALHDVHLKGTLMDRLHLLETRIRQLSSELDKGGGSSGSRSSAGEFTTGRQMNENGSVQAIPPEKNKKQGTALSSSRAVGGPWRAGEIFHRGTRELQDHKSKTKVKDSKEVIDAVEKRASAMCRNEKRRLKRTRLYRRWFPVGC